MFWLLTSGKNCQRLAHQRPSHSKTVVLVKAAGAISSGSLPIVLRRNQIQPPAERTKTLQVPGMFLPESICTSLRPQSRRHSRRRERAPWPLASPMDLRAPALEPAIDSVAIRLRFGYGSVAIYLRFGCNSATIRLRFDCSSDAIRLRFSCDSSNHVIFCVFHCRAISCRAAKSRTTVQLRFATSYVVLRCTAWSRAESGN